MGVFDKLKNVFFEEEYVEVEEPIKKPKKEKTTIAKKVDLPEMPKIREEKTPREIEIEEEVVERVEKKGSIEREIKNEKSFKFPMTFEEDDFMVDSYDRKKEEKTSRTFSDKEPQKHDNLYNSKKEEPIKTDYTYSGLYEGGDYKKEQKVFKPTPIISPIYGILDKNYKKEEIVQKKEIRLSAPSKKVDLDMVREKAYGDLVSDITASMMDNETSNDTKEPIVDTKVENDVEETTLYDLTDDASPVVNSVTVGDAEEYFNDLGLEYNVDYKDHSKEKATGRRSTRIKEEETNKKEEKKEEVEDSLFDLIDSMYQESEEE